MKLTKSLKEIFFLSLPIIFGQVGMVLIGSGDVYVASMFSTVSVAAIGVATGILNPFMLFGIGLMSGISALLSMSKKSTQKKEPHLTTLIIYSIITGLGTTFIALFSLNFIEMISIDKEIIPIVSQYVKIVAWSFPFVTIFTAIKEYLQAYEEVIFPNLITIISVVLNVGLNYFLVFGYGTFEGMGAVGLAIASFSIRVFMTLFLLAYVLRDKWGTFDAVFMKKVFKFSLPISFIFFFEVLAFCFVNVASGTFGVETAAANNIIVMICSLSFMVPLSIGHASAVKIGYAYGKNKILDIISYVHASLILVFGFSLFSSFMYFVFPGQIMNLLTSDANVVKIGVLLFFPIAIFQIVDGFQVCMGGILRGLEETKITSKLVFSAYWLVGIPLGSVLAFYLDWGFLYLWYGIVMALAIVAVGLFFHYLQIINRLKKSTLISE